MGMVKNSQFYNLINWHYFTIKQGNRLQLKPKMGNSNHYTHSMQPQKFHSSHPLFDNAKVIIQKQHKYIVCHQNCQQEQYKKWKQIVLPFKQLDLKLQSQFLMLPAKSSFEYDKGCCTNTGKVNLTYPYFQAQLSQIITKRSVNKEYFKQSQLWQLLYVLTAAKVQLNKRDIKLGDIRPFNTFIDSYHKIKVASLIMTPNQLSNYQQFVNHKQTEFNYLLAPQDMQQAKKQAIDNKGNYKSQIFAIGATVLSAGILNNLQDIYDYKNSLFLDDKFNEKIHEWVNLDRYSEIFRSIVINLTSKPILKRIELAALWKFISHYSVNIENRQPFIIFNPPDCLEQAIPLMRAKKL